MTFYLYDNPHNSAQLTLPGTYTILLVYGQSNNYAARYTTINLTTQQGAVTYSNSWGVLDLFSIMGDIPSDVDVGDLTPADFGLSYSGSWSYGPITDEIGIYTGIHYSLYGDYGAAETAIQDTFGGGHSGYDYKVGTGLTATGTFLVLEIIEYSDGKGQVRLVKYVNFVRNDGRGWQNY
jgi:hypothetical protein